MVYTSRLNSWRPLSIISVVKQDGARTGKQKSAAFVTDAQLNRVSNRDKGGWYAYWEEVSICHG